MDGWNAAFIWVFPKIKVPQNGWWKSWKTLWTNGWFGGYPYFRKHPYWGGTIHQPNWATATVSRPSVAAGNVAVPCNHASIVGAVNVPFWGFGPGELPEVGADFLNSMLPGGNNDGFYIISRWLYQAGTSMLNHPQTNQTWIGSWNSFTHLSTYLYLPTCLPTYLSIHQPHIFHHAPTSPICKPGLSKSQDSPGAAISPGTGWWTGIHVGGWTNPSEKLSVKLDHLR